MDCIFCKIANGEIPSSKIYEDENVLSFLDIGPANKGHALVIPKQHFEKFNDMPEDVLSAVMKAVKKVSMAVEKAVQPEAYNIVTNNGKAAGQVVPHAHIHIIPRYEHDNFKFTWTAQKYEEGEMEEYLDKIKKLL